MKKSANYDLKVFEIREGIYQVEAGKKAIVLPAKSLSDALKLACRYCRSICLILMYKFLIRFSYCSYSRRSLTSFFNLITLLTERTGIIFKVITNRTTPIYETLLR